MITTVCLNPSHNRTISVSDMVLGGANYALNTHWDYIGKGFRVAVNLSRLGENSTVTGFLYRENGEITQSRMSQEGVMVDCIWRPGWIRTNMQIIDESENTITNFYESGEQITHKDVNEVLDKVQGLARQSELLLLTGTLPEGCPRDLLAQIIALCREDCPVILDADGDILLKGITKKPFLIKPNRFELETAVGMTLPNLEHIKEAAISVTRAGVQMVVVSLGSDGAFITNGVNSYYAHAIDVVGLGGTTGAGDRMLAGLCSGIRQKLPLEEVLRLGIASAESCDERNDGLISKKRNVEKLKNKVELIQI